MHRKATVLKIVQPITIVLCAALLVAMAMLDVQQTALLSLAIVILAMVPYFLRFERLRPKPRDIVPIVVLSVIAALGRALFTFAPNSCLIFSKRRSPDSFSCFVGFRIRRG